MAYKNMTNQQYQHEYYEKNKHLRSENFKNYYLNNHMKIKEYQYFYYRRKIILSNYEKFRENLKKYYGLQNNENNVVLIQNNIIINLMD